MGYLALESTRICYSGPVCLRVSHVCQRGQRLPTRRTLLGSYDQKIPGGKEGDGRQQDTGVGSGFLRGPRLCIPCRRTVFPEVKGRRGLCVQPSQCAQKSLWCPAKLECLQCLLGPESWKAARLGKLRVFFSRPQLLDGLWRRLPPEAGWELVLAAWLDI